MISTGHYASNHGGLVIYVSKNWSYKVQNSEAESEIWEMQIFKINDPNNDKKIAIIIGKIYRLLYDSQDKYARFLLEFNALLLIMQSMYHQAIYF